jgi:S1-C subfamily serine protease
MLFIKIPHLSLIFMALSLGFSSAANANSDANKLWPKYSNKTICRLANSSPTTDGYFYAAAQRGLQCGDEISEILTVPVSSKPLCISDSSSQWNNCLGRKSTESETYIGEWSSGKYSGQGVLIGTGHSNGVYVSKWKDGLKTGLWRYWYLGKRHSGRQHNQYYLESELSEWLYENPKQAFIKRTYQKYNNTKLVYLDGSVYTGDFLTIMGRGPKMRMDPYGAGKRTYLDGKVVSGTWRYGELKSEKLPSIHYRAKEVATQLANHPAADIDVCYRSKGLYSPSFNYMSPHKAALIAILRGISTEGCSNFSRYSKSASDISKLISTTGSYDVVAKTQPKVPIVEPIVKAPDKPGESDLPDCPNGTSVLNWNNCFGHYTFSLQSDWSGDTYVGEFRDGRMSGQGTYTWSNGNKYVGEYKNNEPNGQGIFTFGPQSDLSGDKYVGEFKDGKLSGQGIYTSNTGAVLEGIWKDNEFQYARTPNKPAPVAKTPTKPEPVVKTSPKDDQTISASSGSGFAVSSDGYVITNNHVIEGCQDVVVHTKQTDIPMRVITYDTRNDLALLKGDFTPSAVFPLSTERPELLQDIYVAGYPFGINISTSVKVTKGIISSLTGIGNNFSNIQIDAALQSGNSGGPILDDMGNLVGVAVAKLDAKYMFDNFGSIPENTNFGIKASVVKSVLDSSSVDTPSANKSAISKSQLGKMITNGTYYISCWMTLAQIEKVRSKKVLFSELD